MTVRSIALNQMQMRGFHGTSRVPQFEWRTQGPRSAERNQNAPRTDEDVQRAASAISNALSAATASNAFAGRTSDAEVATVSVDNSRIIASMPPRDTEIQVTQLAQAQENRGLTLAAEGNAVSPGTFNFVIEAGGLERSFSIEVGADDNNASIQQMMADTINQANIGVRATISAVGDATTLTLTATQTGTDSAFTVRESELTNAMGITAPTQQAQNAVFTVDGADRTAQTNEVTIAAGVSVTLRGEGEANITFGRTTEQTIAATRDLVSAINTAIRGTDANDGRGSARFLNDVIGMNVSFQASLSRVGIDVLPSGQLSINEARLQSAATDGVDGRPSTLERFFDGGGFTARAGRIADNALHTRQYVNAPPPVNVNNNLFDFGNTSDPWAFINMFG